MKVVIIVATTVELIDSKATVPLRHSRVETVKRRDDNSGSSDRSRGDGKGACRYKHDTCKRAFKAAMFILDSSELDTLLLGPVIVLELEVVALLTYFTMSSQIETKVFKAGDDFGRLRWPRKNVIASAR
jgi:hypothetical protein